MTFDLIVAMDDRNGIGKQGGLPWTLPADLRHFREITVRTEKAGMQNAVIMGRRTWISIPPKFRPLPDRINVVLSRDPDFPAVQGALLARSLPDTAQVLAEAGSAPETVFIIGGQQIYEAALREASCRRIYVTRVRGDFGCDAFFPTIPAQFQKIRSGPVQSENGIEFYFELLEASR